MVGVGEEFCMEGWINEGREVFYLREGLGEKLNVYIFID